MKISHFAAASLLATLAACGGSSGPSIDSGQDLVDLATKAGVECPGEWMQADNDQVMGLLGATDVYRCGDFTDDPNEDDTEYVIVGVFPDKNSRDDMAANTSSAQGPEGLRTFVSGSWLVAAADADKMSDVADGKLLN